MDYPSKPPSVYFLQPTPRHEHVYTNGDICLNLLGRDWRPNMSASTLALSILSMLSSAKEKKIPQDNHVRK
jgi:ubiquitin-conjugating enzyme E2 W